MNLAAAASDLLACRDGQTPQRTLATEWRGFDVETVRAIEDEVLLLRIDRGEAVIGLRVGLPVPHDGPAHIGWLTDAMVLAYGEAAPAAGLVRQGVHAEIALIMGSPLEGDAVTMATALGAVSGVMGCAVITDARCEVLLPGLSPGAVNHAAVAALATGPRLVSPDALDLSFEACLLEVDGKVVDSATGAAVLGHPAHALALAARAVAARREVIEKGWMVLTGSMTQTVSVPPGSTAAVHFTHLGSVLIPSS